MRTFHGIWTPAILLVAGLALPSAAQADFEVTGPDGRQIFLKDDGTWRYVGVKDKEAARDKEPAKDTKGKPMAAGEAILRLEGRTEIGYNCCFDLRLVVFRPFEFRSFSPVLSAYRSNGVIYDSVLVTFQTILLVDSQRLEILFCGVACFYIVRVLVVGGDRC